MPTLRDKLADFLRQLSTGTERAGADPKAELPSPTSATATFMQRYLNGEGLPKQPEIVHSKSCYDLPNRDIAPLSKRILAAYTGPSGGLTRVNRGPLRALTVTDQVDFIDDDSLCGSNENLASRYLDRSGSTPKAKPSASFSSNSEGPRVADTACVTGEEAETASEEIAGICNWNQPAEFAYGIATTLYECHPITKENAGEPIADAFAICVRENSAIMALADGVNWGDKSCLAARCAVHGCMDYLNRALYREGGTIETTQEVFVCLLRSFQAAHSLILQEQGMLTTLCAAVAVKLQGSDQYVVCTCNVGDSLAYVYSQQHGVREITLGSHDIHSMRDMRDALGALGPVDGQNPELNNLTVSMTVVQPGDIVFLTSDGISDNFDPVVGKFAIAKRIRKDGTNTQQPLPRLPEVEAHQRHALTLLRMQDLLQQGLYQGDGACSSAEDLCERMVDFATKLTAAKRRILEDPELYAAGAVPGEDARRRRHRAGPRLTMVPGKLDHASLVAYQVGTGSRSNAHCHHQRGGRDMYDGQQDRANRNIPSTPGDTEDDYPDNLPYETTI
ncbi:PP2C-like domain-containing protein CG9801 [Rhipicephalus microplus]|uniref:PP2C-like domain-containing protein CG9801 n=1 Tax=Rhipicephalus microplus TaxID=6941 RepID=UPI003F6B07AA